MTNKVDDAINKNRERPQNIGYSVMKCWDAIASYSKKELPLNQIYAEAENVVQYCVVASPTRDVEWLKKQVETHERFAAARLAADPGDLKRQRAHAALAGAR